MDISINYDKCNNIGCLECLDICPMDVFDLIAERLVYDISKCVGCLACQEVCAYDAIRVLY
ncbi:4Fe-4S binding protein [Methanosphaera sp. ISO3-F5]|uniref:indolepyruvate ferredoxin oxidoreductase subunit alpha n=1 Tax=Methanosphaera sp. ISO3-F5 TaxID=1452353 RepID=UPI002B256F4F|nr:4Fe-4S binding protein [Methanosphaera sp. ISO3-F5]WQH63753.1 4Fe-4S binding protein [Methanosphaera sp. ISO3-F5]